MSAQRYAAMLEEWSAANARARAEYYAHPSVFRYRHDPECIRGDCTRSSGRSKLCWKHRNEERQQRAAHSPERLVTASTG